MATEWILTYKPGFLNEVLALPEKNRDQVLTKIVDLERDPRADGHAKKQLKHMKNKLHRLRSGDFRIFYTFDETHVSLLALRRRDDETYDADVDPEFLGGGAVDVDLEDIESSIQTQQPRWEDWIRPVEPQRTPLPEPITPDLLRALRVPEELDARLLPLESQEQLLECPGVPDEILLKIDEHMFARPVSARLEEKDLVGASGDDLFRYVRGELQDFLLKLSPEQEQYARWAISASGPTLVKGGPGSGKSTVALYRVREILRVLRSEGEASPRILFTTYTRPLVNMTKQLLALLLEPADLRRVEVRNYDTLVREVVQGAGRRFNIAKPNQERSAFSEAFRGVRLSGTADEQAKLRSFLDRLGVDYLRDEVLSIIQGRDLPDLAAYQAAARHGRQIPFTAQQREAVWAIHLEFMRRLTAKGLRTWQQARAEAADLVHSGRAKQLTYDAVVIDEAQDLDPTVLRMLVGMSAAPNRLFITADQNQSIYRSGFNWSDVHDDLNFRGRTGVLRANHRSTRQVAEAARSYLGAGTGSVAPDEQSYVHEGPAPAVRRVESDAAETELLLAYFNAASRELRLTLGSCAVLVPTNAIGSAIAERLCAGGLEAVFQESDAVDLTTKAVKVITLQASKGLEFPIVAVAGLLDPHFPFVPPSASVDAVVETLAKDRRTMFVAMTRAMRALLVLPPAGSDSTLYEGFDPQLWNLG